MNKMCKVQVRKFTKCRAQTFRSKLFSTLTIAWSRWVVQKRTMDLKTCQLRCKRCFPQSKSPMLVYSAAKTLCNELACMRKAIHCLKPLLSISIQRTTAVKQILKVWNISMPKLCTTILSVAGKSISICRLRLRLAYRTRVETLTKVTQSETIDVSSNSNLTTTVNASLKHLLAKTQTVSHSKSYRKSTEEVALEFMKRRKWCIRCS